MPAQMMTELLLTCEDRVGVFAELLAALSEAGVNLLGYVGYTMDERAYIHVVPDNAEKAAAVMETHGCKVQTGEVIYLLQDDRVGAGADLAQIIAEAGINMFHCYATSAESGAYGSIISSADNARVLSLLRG